MKRKPSERITLQQLGLSYVRTKIIALGTENAKLKNAIAMMKRSAR